MLNAVEIVKAFCVYDLADRDVDKAVALLAENVCWYGTTDGEDIHSKKEAHFNLTQDIKQNSKSYKIEFSEEKFMPLVEGGVAFLRLWISQGQMKMQMRLTATTCLEAGQEKIATMHFSLAAHQNERSEKFYLKAQLDRLNKEKEALVLSTMSGGLMGGYCEEGFPFYFINDHMLNYLGYASEEEFVQDIKGLISNVMHPEDRARVDEVTRAALEKSGRYEVDYRMRRKDGSYIMVHDIGKLGFDENGKDVIVSVCYDITESHEKQAQMDNLANALPGGMALYRVVNGELEMIYQSDGVGELTGRTAEEYEKLIHNSAKDSVHPDDWDKVKKALQQAVECDHAVSTDYRIPFKGGGYVRINGSFRRTGTENGHPILHCVFIKSSDENNMYQVMAQKSNNGIYVISQENYQILYMNNQAKKAFEIDSKVDVGAQPCYKLLRHCDAQCADCPVFDMEKEGKSYKLHVDHLNKYFEGTPYKLDWAGIPAYVVNISDVTEQVEQQEKYQRVVESRYKALDKNVALVGYCNVSRNILLGVEDRTGMDLVKRFGMKRDEFFKGLGSAIPNEQQREEFYRASLSAPLIKDYAQGIFQHDAEFMLLNETISVEPLWFKLHIDVVEEPDTKELMGFLNILNITQRKRQEQMLENVAYSNYEYISRVNVYEDTIMFYFSSKNYESKRYEIGASFNYTKLVQEVAELITIPLEKEKFVAKTTLANIKGQLKDKDNFAFNFHVREQGKLRTKRLRVDMLDRDYGTAVMTCSDVTQVVAQQEQQKKQMAEALEIAEKANKHKTEFLASMSHDIRTPMNAIVSMCDMALANEQDTNQVHDSLETIHSSSQVLLTLINNILDMSRIESGKMLLQKAPFSILNQINKTAVSHKVLAQQKNQEFMLYTNIIHDNCIGDATRIHSAIDNVLANAVKYTPEGGKIIYRVSELSSGNKDIGIYRFEISDNGIGISEEDRERIFDPFYRGKSEDKLKASGSGLGLSITKQIVDLQGGTISIKSAPHIGTTFVIEIPLYFSSEILHPNYERLYHKEDKYDFTGLNILLCEDHPVNQKVMLQMLKKVNANVTIAENGQIALDKFAQSEPNTYQLIFMDIRMPIMDGYEAAMAIRSSGHADAQRIPIVALSANAFSEDVQKSLEHGMNGHIAKPVTPLQVYEQIKKYCYQKDESISVKHKILFVDDVELNIAVLTANLYEDYELFIARNGREALNILEQNFDMAAVITDIIMPEMDGLTLLKTIRANPRYDRVALIANTQYGGIEQEIALRKIGADDFLYKPTTPELVEKRLKAAILKHAGK